MALNYNPTGIEKVQDDRLRITWEDGHVSEWTFQYLRQHCPCAMCRDEWSGESLLDPATVPVDMKAERATVVGNYALTFAFADGHGTGIFSFEVLRKLCQCPECSHHPSSEYN